MKVLILGLLILFASCGKFTISGVRRSAVTNPPPPPVLETPWIRQLGSISNSLTMPPLNLDTSSRDFCSSVTTDQSGNVYCAGYTQGSLGEGNGGDNDAFVMKLNSSGVIQWITQLGDTTTGTGGDNSMGDFCYGVAVDSAGNVYCAGQTFGSLGEGQAGLGDAFVMKLNSSGVIQWITQLGDTTIVPGGDTAQSDTCLGVTVDLLGNVYCAGITDGSIGEGNGGNYDAFVMKLDSSGDIQWITQLGNTTTGAGGDNSQFDHCYKVAVDGLGNVYCGGETQGSIGEGNGGGTDVFVMKLNTSGVIQWITQLGDTTTGPGGDNTQADICYGIAVDASANVYCAGGTEGALGEENAGSADALVMKLNSLGHLN